MSMLSPGEKRVLLAELIKKKSAGPKTVPLSFAQQRLWFLDQLSPGNAFYNIDSAIPLQVPADPEILERSLNEVVRRHESLRTTFRSENGEPVQSVTPSLRLQVPVIDLRGLPESERRAEATRLATEEARKPFDLSRGPLVRLTLLRLDDSSEIMLVTLHHIVADGWSIGVFFSELSALYDAFSDGRPSPLPELEIQYADFAAWQRQWFRGDILRQQLEYWKDLLAGLSALELPLDRPRPSVQSYCGAYQPIFFSKEISAGIKALCQAEDVTPFMALLAAFQALLARYTGQDDIAVGTPVAGRNRVELESVIGFFVNTLVMRSDLSGDPSFRALLRRVRETALGAFAHQDLPFEMLVGELQPERDLSRNPLFQVMFQFFKPPDAGSGAGAQDWTEPAVEVARGTSIFDLALHIGETPNGLAGNWEYSTELFDKSTILRASAHLQKLLTGVIADPDLPLSKLPLFDHEERQRILVEWNRTEDAAAPAGCLHHLFEQWVELSPDAPALRDGDFVSTYRELDLRANCVAAWLRGQGVGPDVPVCISIERSTEMMVAVLAVLKAGGACVPLDPSYPSERRALILADAGEPLVLTAETIRAAGQQQADWVAPRVNSGNLAYILYTSGSTGVPKGVAMPHSALVNLMAWQARHTEAGAGTRTLQFASLNFDVSFQEIFSTWSTGGTLVLVSDATRRDPFLLLRHLATERIERLFVPFVALHQLAEAASHRGSPRLVLREVVTAGEQLRLTPKIVAWMEQLGCTLDNQYGPTESHVVTSCKLSGIANGWPALPPIGRPVSNVRIYLLDRHLEPVPIGAPGEIFIAGTGLARGYWNSQELTAEKFLMTPLGRLYRTGDLARYRADGMIDFLGRADHQVKIRGYRVELGEIEVVLARHPAVREAVVIAHEAESGQKRLAAYVVPAGDSGVDGAELRQFLLERLPEYMVPALFIKLDALPTLPSGKVNRRALSSQGSDLSAPRRERVAPRNPTEEKLAAIWMNVLGTSQPGVHDDFFADLGGHSLLATQVASRVRDVFSVELPLTAIFEHPTVAGMAEWLVTACKIDENRIVPLARKLRRVAVQDS